jgi:hypothetical protein
MSSRPSCALWTVTNEKTRWELSDHLADSLAHRIDAGGIAVSCRGLAVGTDECGCPRPRVRGERKLTIESEHLAALARNCAFASMFAEKT